jgi:hypothetical protein
MLTLLKQYWYEALFLCFILWVWVTNIKHIVDKRKLNKIKES